MVLLGEPSIRKDVSVVLRFANVEIDEARAELRVDGVPQPIERQAFEVLRYLASHQERVVAREELLDEVWGTRFVGDASITSAIKTARRAIGDSGREQRFIRTVQGRGYRFVGESTDVASTENATVARAPGRRFDDGWPIVGRDDELQSISSLVESSDAVGVLLTGPAGVGKTRLARAVIERFEATGRPVARINGHVGAASVPLAALAHLLPTDIAAAADLRGDLAHTVLLERARAVIAELAGDGQLLLMVDDVDRVDSLSLALLGSLISTGSVAAVMTQRDAGDNAVFSQLIAGGQVRRVDLSPVSDDRLAELLGRVLDGPIQPETTSTLLSRSAGNPGLLRQLVERSRGGGALAADRHGVWQLVGPLAAGDDLEALAELRLADLDPAGRAACELLAVAGELPLDLTFELIDDETLDELELAGLLTVRGAVRETRVRLMHPLFGEVVSDRMTAIRGRSVRRELSTALAAWIERGRSVQATDRLQLVRLQLHGDGRLDESMAFESARLAVIEGDAELTGNILDRLEPSDPTAGARKLQLHAEQLFLQGRFVDAGQVLRSIDIELLEEEEAAYVIRRVATAMFYGHVRQRDATEFLAEHFDRFEGSSRHTLEAYWVMQTALDGRDAEAALALGIQLVEQAEGFPRAEATAGMAMARLVRGEVETASALVEEFEQLAATLPASLTWAGPDYADFVKLTVLMELGQGALGRAEIDRLLPDGSLPTVGFLAIGAGRLAHRMGDHEQAQRWLAPLAEFADAIGLASNARPMQSTLARCALATGDHALARRHAAILEDTLSGIAADEWSFGTIDMLETVGRVEAVTGDRDAAVERLIEGAPLARSVNQTIMEASLLSAAVEFGGASAAIDRLEELADLIEPGLIELKVRHARAALDGGTGLDEVAADYARMGLETVAAAVRETPVGSG